MGWHLGGQILIVDDDAPIRSLLTLIARRAGFSVDVASDGADALDKLGKNEYLVVLLDLMIPRVSGDEVIDRLRAMKLRPAVIAVTAMATAFDSALDPEVVYTVIRKPFDIDVVANLIIDCARDIHNTRASKSVSPPSPDATPLTGTIN